MPSPDAHGLAPPASLVRIPEDRVLAMLDSCAEQIARVATIEDAKEASTVAEAIAAVTRKVNVAKEVKRKAVRLLVEAEAKLGEILRAIPRASASTPAKRDVLREHGINKRRASCFAERLAVTPQADVDRVISGGAQTLHGVTAKLGIHANGYELRIQKASAIAFLCEEAVALLERCVTRGQVPHAGTVQEMVRRLHNIKTHGNASLFGGERAVVGSGR